MQKESSFDLKKYNDKMTSKQSENWGDSAEKLFYPKRADKALQDLKNAIKESSSIEKTLAILENVLDCCGLFLKPLQLQYAQILCFRLVNDSLDEGNVDYTTDQFRNAMGRFKLKLVEQFQTLSQKKTKPTGQKVFEDEGPTTISEPSPGEQSNMPLTLSKNPAILLLQLNSLSCPLFHFKTADISFTEELIKLKVVPQKYDWQHPLRVLNQKEEGQHTIIERPSYRNCKKIKEEMIEKITTGLKNKNSVTDVLVLFNQMFPKGNREINIFFHYLCIDRAASKNFKRTIFSFETSQKSYPESFKTCVGLFKDRLLQNLSKGEDNQDNSATLDFLKSVDTGIISNWKFRTFVKDFQSTKSLQEAKGYETDEGTGLKKFQKPN